MNNEHVTPPNGFFVYLSENGEWVMDCNRFSTIVVTEDIRREMEEQQNILWRDDYAELPDVGQVVGRVEGARRSFDSLDSLCAVMPHLWGWVTGIEDDIPEFISGD